MSSKKSKTGANLEPMPFIRKFGSNEDGDEGTQKIEEWEEAEVKYKKSKHSKRENRSRSRSHEEKKRKKKRSRSRSRSRDRDREERRRDRKNRGIEIKKTHIWGSCRCPPP
jgi:hypothetical protein